jgi:Tol biopolymer transport system component
MIVVKALKGLWKRDRAIFLACLNTMLVLCLYILFVIQESAVTRLPVMAEEQADYLVYVIEGYSGYKKGQLMFYDPAEDIHEPLLPDWDVERIAVGATDRLAFTTVQEEERGIYILDYPFMDVIPVRIAGPLSARYFQLAWSQDGRYLAYVSADDEGATLSMWDGTTIRHIYRSPETITDITWGPDGRLAFTVFYTFTSPYEGDRSEVFVWDEGITTSLSQNPSGNDSSPAWSEDGRLAFLSDWQGSYDIFVWDGVAKVNGVPDRTTFINVAPNLTGYYSYPTWTNSGSLTFEAARPKDENLQIYEWDGAGVTDISQYPDSHSVGGHWRPDGYWAFMTSLLSSEHLIFVRDEKNQTRLTAEGHSPTWSPNGQLMFCTAMRPDWKLSVWNGRSIIEVGQGSEIQALWPNGEGVVCTNG